jgi:voltage-gated potassium channel
MMKTETTSTRPDALAPELEAALETERESILQQLDDWLETPLLILSFVWLALLVIELVSSLTPFLESVGTVIWIIFGLDFALRFWIAPHKVKYLKNNWITALALFLPALRVLRIARLARLLRASRAVRGLRLVRLFTSLNRGLKALRAGMGRRGFGYVLAATVIVTFAGAAGMFAFENQVGSGFKTYTDALWWTAMLMTTLGSEQWPQTGEGRVLCFLLSVFAFTIFGYVTATLATFFLGRDAENAEGEIAGEQSIAALSEEIRALREELRELQP